MLARLCGILHRFRACNAGKGQPHAAQARLAQIPHSNFRGVRLGQIYVEASLYTKTEAEEFKVGEAQNEPNRLPYLANPKRNPPPWAIGSRALDYFAAQRTKIIILCTVCLLLVIAVPLVFVALTANSAS